MQQFLLSFLLSVLFLPIIAQEKTWEIATPYENMAIGEFLPDYNNPQIFYTKGVGSVREFTLDGKWGERFSITLSTQDPMKYTFLSDATQKYFITQVFYSLNDSYSNTWSTTWVERISQGEKNTINSISTKGDQYLNIVGFHIIDGQLYSIMGGGDAYNRKPQNSYVFKISRNSEIESKTNIQFPNMYLDSVVYNRLDKDKYKFMGSWHEVNYDPSTFESIIFRISQIETKTEASLFSLNLKNGAIGNKIKLEVPFILSNKYIRSACASGVNRHGVKEFIVQAIISEVSNSGTANSTMLIMRYALDGTFLGSNSFGFIEFSGNDASLYKVGHENVAFPDVVFDNFGEEYVFIQTRFFKMFALDADLNKSKRTYPKIRDVYEGKAETPSNLPSYWADYYKKPQRDGLAGIYFGQDFVLVSHYDKEVKQSTISCYR